jgi:hypothetical protein
VLTADGPDGAEERFALPIDERVRAAARGDARLGAIEDLGNTLPPRVIQARIRAGESPEQVAFDSGTRVDRIMRFAHPVLQERARIAEQSLQARVRLSEGTPTVPLEQFMAERLRLLGADLDAVRWDAARGADGTWLVTGAWKAGHKTGTTRWAYDIPARLVTPVDAATTDFAEGTRLVRVVPDVPGGGAVAVAAPRPHDPPAPAPVRSEEPLPPPAPVAGEPAVAEEPPAAVPPHVDDGIPDDIAEHDTVVLGRTDDETDDPRARIPAWEDIVFGIRRHR